jgi:hypothetical protein
MSGLELSKEVDASFKELLKDLWLSPEYLYLIQDAIPSAISNALEKELKECVEEMVWQGYLAGLKDSRVYDPIYNIQCSYCLLNNLTESSDGEIITHDLALEEGWTYDFDKEVYFCDGCSEPMNSDDS